MPYIHEMDCVVPECDDTAITRQMCPKHYQRYRAVQKHISVDTFAEMGGPTLSQWKRMVDEDDMVPAEHCKSCTCMISDEERDDDDEVPSYVGKSWDDMDPRERLHYYAATGKNY